jgi:hypothetical protein
VNAPKFPIGAVIRSIINAERRYRVVGLAHHSMGLCYLLLPLPYCELPIATAVDLATRGLIGRVDAAYEPMTLDVPLPPAPTPDDNDEDDDDEDDDDEDDYCPTCGGPW